MGSSLAEAVDLYGRSLGSHGRNGNIGAVNTAVVARRVEDLPAPVSALCMLAHCWCSKLATEVAAQAWEG